MMVDWIQKGFAIVSRSHGSPLMHCFNSALDFAEYELRKSQELPEHLRIDLQIVPAELHFSFPAKDD